MTNPYNPSNQIPTGVGFTQPKALYRYGEVTVWSTQQLAVAVANSTSRLFTTPRGQVGQGFAGALSIAETSIKEGGRVPSGLAYDVFGIAAEISNANGGTALQTQNDVNDLVNIQHNGVLSWDFQQTVIDIAPVILCGAGGGAFGALGNAAAQGAMNNGNGSVFMYRKSPVALPGGCTFAIQLQIGANAVALNAIKDVRVTLFGYYKSVITIG